MKVFQIYQHPTKGIKVVHEGFNVNAFVFGVLWMLAFQLWSMAFLWTLLYILLFFISAGIASSANDGVIAAWNIISMLWASALWVIPPIYGNAWKAANLKNRGFALLAKVEAKNKDSAIAHAFATTQQA